MRKSLIALSALAATAMPTFAADYSDGDIHKNDYKWMQFNLMYSINEAPRDADADSNVHDFLEMEFGGRSGIFDLYGYVDIFNLADRDSSDKSDATEKAKSYMKFAPRMSLDGLTGKDLSIGAIKEVYVATLFSWGGGANDNVNNAFVGLGADVMVPWFGKVGVNTYALYDINQKDWNGYQASVNWFKPFFFFENESFISYQGYIDWQFGMRESMGAGVSDGGAMYNGIHWHSNQYSVGYGLKTYKNIYGIQDSSGFVSTGFSHYITAAYKF